MKNKPAVEWYKSAVEWLVSQLNKEGFAQVVTDEEINQAKEMEKQQIINALHYFGIENAEQYFNETFKNK
jgi:hypothetical protein